MFHDSSCLSTQNEVQWYQCRPTLLSGRPVLSRREPLTMPRPARSATELCHGAPPRLLRFPPAAVPLSPLSPAFLAIVEYLAVFPRKVTMIRGNRHHLPSNTAKMHTRALFHCFTIPPGHLKNLSHCQSAHSTSPAPQTQVSNAPFGASHS